MITAAVPGFRMASDYLASSLLPPCATAQIDCFVLAFLVFAFGLCDIPGNEDNWGWASPSSSSCALRLVDFSFASPAAHMMCNATLASRERFSAACDGMMARFWAQQNRVELRLPSASELGAAGLSALGSKVKFADALERALHDTIDWVNDDEHNASWRSSISLSDASRMLYELEAYTRFIGLHACDFFAWFQ
ncbi:Hypothetical protein UVM_LOCUS253 [uncultured virus]|nr:Hypothetical protein UVM_LOCUS253 [uncultured virus]